MQFFAIAAIFAGAVMASPTPGLNLVCPPGLYSNAQCCGTGVLDLLRLDCSTPNEIPRDAEHLKEVCARIGKAPSCCTVPVANQGVLCNNPVGIN